MGVATNMSQSHITVGYRKCKTIEDAVNSMIFTFNNETMNALTMIIGLIIATILYVFFAPANNSLFLLFYFSVLLHVPISVTYHTLCNNIEIKIVETSLKLDITATFTSSLILAYVLSACVFKSKHLFYLALFTYIISMYILHFSSFKLRDISKAWFASFFSVIVICYLLPMLYVKSVYGIVASIALLIGGLVYIFEIPERYVDKELKDLLSYVGNSHNILHICLIIAHVAEFFFLKSYCKN